MLGCNPRQSGLFFFSSRCCRPAELFQEIAEIFFLSVEDRVKIPPVLVLVEVCLVPVDFLPTLGVLLETEGGVFSEAFPPPFFFLFWKLLLTDSIDH